MVQATATEQNQGAGAHYWFEKGKFTTLFTFFR
jgi:hypothetical protein